MADIALVTADRVRVVESLRQMTLPAAEAITAGAPVRIDTSLGRFTKANATSDAEKRVWGLAVRTVGSGEALTALALGVMDGWDLSAMNYDEAVFLSATDGRLADGTPAVNEQQTLTITGTPTGGTFTLTFDGEVTTAIAYNATAATIVAALIVLNNIEADDISATGGALPGAAVVFTFRGKYAGQDVALMTADISALTGGAPAHTLTSTTAPAEVREIGRVIPGAANLLGVAYDKLLEVNCLG